MAEEEDAGILQFLVQLRDEFSKPLGRIAEHAEGFKTSMQKIGAAAAEAFLGYEVLAHTIEPAMEMQKALASLAQTTDATAEQLKEAREEADKLSTTYGKSAEDVIAATGAMSKFTGGIDSARETMATAAQFATIMGTSVAEAVQILGPAMSTMGNQALPVAERMQNVSDKIASLIKSMPIAAGGTQRMAMSLAQTAAVAKQFHMSVDQALAADAALGRSGVARNAGVSFAQLTEQMFKMEKGVSLIHKAGFAVYHFRDGTVDLVNTMKHLQDRGPAALAAFENQLGTSGKLLQILLQNVDGVAKGTNDLQNVSGTTSAEAAKQQATLAMQLDNLKNSVTDLEVAFGTELLPAITSGVVAMKDLVNQVREFGEAHPVAMHWIAVITGAAAAALALGGAFYVIHAGLGAVISGYRALRVIGTLGGLLSETSMLWAGMTSVIGLVSDFWALIPAIGGVSEAFTALGLAISANPLGAIIVGVALLGIAAYEAYEHWDKIKQWFAEGVDFIRGHMALIAAALGPLGLLADAAVLVADHWGSIKATFTDGVAWVIKELGYLKGPIDWLEHAAGVVAGAWEHVFGGGGGAGGGGAGPAPVTAAPPVRQTSQNVQYSPNITVQVATGASPGDIANAVNNAQQGHAAALSSAVGGDDSRLDFGDTRFAYGG